jgi:hypothetical protein
LHNRNNHTKPTGDGMIAEAMRGIIWTADAASCYNGGWWFFGGLTAFARFFSL